MQPNIDKKNLYSDLLGMNFNLWVSTKARKCIMKAGSLDNYLLNTKPAVLDSKMALLLRNMVLAKKKNPDYEPPRIPGFRYRQKLGKRRTQLWEYKNIPAMYMTAQQKLECDHTEFYIRSPQEMSRYEEAQLEAELRSMQVDRDETEDMFKQEEEVDDGTYVPG